MSQEKLAIVRRGYERWDAGARSVWRLLTDAYAEVVNPPEANRSRQGLASPGQPLEDDLDRRAALLRVAPRNAFAHLANLGRE